MNDYFDIPPRSWPRFDVTGWCHRCAGAMRQKWRRFGMDPYTAWLSDSIDCADLERRMKSWEATRRFDRLPPR